MDRKILMMVAGSPLQLQQFSSLQEEEHAVSRLVRPQSIGCSRSSTREEVKNPKDSGNQQILVETLGSGGEQQVMQDSEATPPFSKTRSVVLNYESYYGEHWTRLRAQSDRARFASCITLFCFKYCQTTILENNLPQISSAALICLQTAVSCSN